MFNIGIETCSQCGGTINVIACIEDPEVIKQILAHIQNRSIFKKSRSCFALASSRLTFVSSSSVDVDVH